ncbi:MAG: hypothetical protein AAFZ15_22285 [Bacteroidota bacterium]
MKLLKLHFFLLFTCFLFSHSVNAQWDLFADLLGQLEDQELNDYFNNLDELNQNWDIDQFDLNTTIDNHYDLLNNPFPGGLLDSSYIFGLEQGIGDLDILLDDSGLADNDQGAILGELDRIQDIFNMNFDSLGGLYGQYEDSLGTDPNWDVTILNYDEQVDTTFGLLQDSLDIITNGSMPDDAGGIANILGDLFSQSLFSDLELAFGTQSSNLKYWDDQYSADAKVLRVGSVPSFDRTVIDGRDGIFRVPIETRWHMEVSWINGRIPFTVDNSQLLSPSESDNDNPEYNYNNSSDRKFNPLMFFGDFALMATPTVGQIGNTSFRLITSLGLEAATYAPAHREYNPSRTGINRGFATGFGPQVGSGFSIINGPVIVYTMGTITRGELLRSELPYTYQSTRFEAGIRYGNIINVRCSTGRVSWQENDNRRADIGHQVTIGIILDSLFR